MKCAPTLFNQTNKKHTVKLNELKLELELFETKLVSKNNIVAIKISGVSTKKGKNPCTQITSSRRFYNSKSPSLFWDSNDLFGFNLLVKDGSFDVTFHILYGEGVEMVVVGEVSVRLHTAEMVVSGEMNNGFNSNNLQRRLPIELKVNNGLFIQATIVVCLRLLKVGNSDENTQGFYENLEGSEKKKHGVIGKVKFLRKLSKKNNENFYEAEQLSHYESDGSPVFDSDDSFNDSTTSSGSSNGSSRNSIIQHRGGSNLKNRSEKLTNLVQIKTTLDTVLRNWSEFSWNRRFLKCFKTTTTKSEIVTTYSGPLKKSDELSPEFQDNNHGPSSWKNREILSRDGEARVKMKVFFASFDQRSEQASGESACTVLVALIADWLNCNMDMPTRSEFDNLITQGSSEWRRLCNNDCYLSLFPDKHFDLETIIEANLRPLTVVPQKSYTGFFSPEKFECLKGAMSFDEIWDEINNSKDNYNSEPRIYIVSWNDHFFVLKVEADCYYIIDSLGERLVEGCKQAFILKFDDSSVMHRKVEKKKNFEILCSGKECCKEFIKRFLAAIPLEQLERQQNRGNASNHYLHRQLQIDFHYISSTSSSSFSSPSSSSSPLSSEPIEEAKLCN